MKKVILVVLDGWGVSEEVTGNAIVNASTPNMDSFTKYYPSTILQASGIAVGLPWGKMGNSEVGHLILGAGKIIYQSLPRVSLSIQDRTFFDNEMLQKAIKHANDNMSNIHLMGLVSDGGVHSHVDHLYALLEFLKMNSIDSSRVFVHAFTDGRDTDPQSGVKYLSELRRNIKEECWPGRVASVSGRYYAMDRNNNWDRTKLAYYCLVNEVGSKNTDDIDALKASYSENITDEFIKPTLIADKNGNFGLIKQNDTVIFFNIREDRARQLTKAFVIDDFKDFDRGGKVQNLFFATMIEYERGLPVNVFFPPEHVNSPLGKILSENSIRQLRIAETEKYAHVTYFFNGGREEPYKDEYRVLVPSPQVAKYDATPEMSAEVLTDEVIKEIESDNFGFILINYANADMVGHTGNFKATIKAIESVDSCLGRLYEAAMQHNMSMLITADHGNAEEKSNPRTGEVLTEHTTNPVPFILIDQDSKFIEEKPLESSMVIGGMLSDVAPTILELYGINKPEEMTGRSLLDSLR